ncbi:unnamed protein product [Paramecium primaurelia]|uniref:Uncharacterized protein n=1 Tax=Paramecium primaurelia TaxID=5886 RepID=A0A8S1M0E2_PARPR|nr:unnamed protein product [Paramecium primaurelia]
MIDYYFNFKRDNFLSQDSKNYLQIYNSIKRNQIGTNIKMIQSFNQSKNRFCQVNLIIQKTDSFLTYFHQKKWQREKMFTYNEQKCSMFYNHEQNRLTFKNYIAEKVPKINKIVDIWIILNRNKCLIFHYIWIIILKLLKSQWQGWGKAVQNCLINCII